MKMHILCLAATFAATVATAGAATLHRGETVLLVGENAAMCPTVLFANQLAEAYSNGDPGKIQAMMIDHGGPCIPASILRRTPLKVAVTNRADGLTGVHLASNPRGGVEWVLPGFLMAAP